MKQSEFLSELKTALGSIGEDKKQEILYDYEEHFRNGIAENNSEEEISASLGDPVAIGKSYRIESIIENANTSDKLDINAIIRAIFISLSLTAFNVIFVAVPFLVLLTILLALWSIAFTLILIGFYIFISLIPGKNIYGSTINIGNVHFVANDPFLNIVLLICSSLVFLSLGVLFGIGMIYITQWIFKGIAAYVKINARIIRKNIKNTGGLDE